MKVLVWATGQDTGGQGYRIGMAFRRYADTDEWLVDVVNDSPSSLGYPELNMGARMQQRRLVASLYRAADVVHLRHSLRGYQQQDGGQGKPVLLHHHGSQYRLGHGRLSSVARRIGALEVASTIDLVLLEPGVEWLPSPYDVEPLVQLRAQARLQVPADDLVRVAHMPTSAKTKNSDAILGALRDLQADGHRLEIITNVDARGEARHVPWNTALWHKARADVYVDQLTLGYGNNAVEAWAMGQPVVAGVADPLVRDAMLARWGRLPFIEATVDNVQQVLARVLASAGMRDEYAAIGMEHLQRYHASRAVVQQLQGLYTAARPTNPKALLVVPGGARWTERHGRGHQAPVVALAQPFSHDA